MLREGEIHFKSMKPFKSVNDLNPHLLLGDVLVILFLAIHDVFCPDIDIYIPRSITIRVPFLRTCKRYT